MSKNAVSSAAELRIDGMSGTCANGVHALREVTLSIPVGTYGFRAGIDPHHPLDWVESGDDDNIEVATIDSGLASAPSDGVLSKRALSDDATSMVGGR